MEVKIVQIPSCLAVLLLFTRLSTAIVTIDAPDPSYNLKETQREQIVVELIRCSVDTGSPCSCNLVNTRPLNGPFEVIGASTSSDHELYYIGEVRGQRLDFSGTRSWDVTVQCEDPSNTSDSATQVYEIDIKKNTKPDIINWPQDSLSLEIARDRVGVRVYELRASDVDGDDLKYSILSDSQGNFFSIDQLTGYVTLEKDLRTSPADQIILELSVSDGLDSREPFVLTIDITDANKAPEFSGLSDMTIPEDEPANSELLTIVVNDDGTPPTLVPTCEITSPPGTFDIVYNHARQTVRVGQAAFGVSPLDFDAGPRQYTLTCEATDGYLTTSKTVTIRVTNVNEPPVFSTPTYSCLIDETIETNTYGGSSCDPNIVVTDPDGDTIVDVNLVSMAINNQNQFFKYDHSTGLLSFRSDYDVDNLAGKTVTPVLTVEATDEHGEKSTADIEVTVQDVNDNTCSFNPKDPTFNADQGTAIGVLGTIQATDNDRTSPNNEVTIEEVSGDTNYIRVSTVGQIRYARAIPESLHRTTFLLTIRCKDGGRPSRSSTTTVALTYMTTTTTTTTSTTTTPTTTTTTARSNEDIWDDDAFVVVFALLALLIAIGLLAGLYFLLRFCCSSPAGLCAGTDPESRWDCCRQRPQNKVTKVKPAEPDDFPNAGYRESANNYKEIAWKTYDGFEDGRIHDRSGTIEPYIGGRRQAPPVGHF